MIAHQSTKLALHQQRVADLRAGMLLLELGAGIRVDAPDRQQDAAAPPAAHPTKSTMQGA